MKLRAIKEFLDKLSDEQLEEDAVYMSHEHSLSGTFNRLKIAQEDLYLWDEDHPASLYTIEQLRDVFDVTDDELEELTIEIYEGDVVFEF